MNQTKVQYWIGGAAKVMADGSGNSLNAKTNQSSTYTYLLVRPVGAPTNAYLKAGHA